MFTPATLELETNVALMEPLVSDTPGAGDALDGDAPLDLIIEAVEEAVNAEKLLAYAVCCSCCSSCSCSNCGSCVDQMAA